MLSLFLPVVRLHLQIPHQFAIGSTFSMLFNTTVATPAGLTNQARFRVVLVHPGFSTHNQRHGMRNIYLEITKTAVSE